MFFVKRQFWHIQTYQKELLETHYHEVENMYQQMRGWRHDYRNHIQMMKAYAANDDLVSIKKYLDRLDEELNSIDALLKTGNVMADAILNSKISLAKAHGIEVLADVCIPIRLQISELDLCVIIGNLFDNAIEANMELPKEQRMIRVYMDMKNTQLYISFTNYTARKKQSKLAGRFQTMKGPGHGLGLQRIEMVIKKAGGYISCNCEEGAFTTEILLPQN